jgi:WhiB family redox-sensing transcriptional regulator
MEHDSDLSLWQRPDWHSSAACRGIDPALFFPTRGSNVTAGIKVLCSTCPVRNACRTYATDRPERHGWWGSSERERRNIRHARRHADDAIAS